MMEVRLDGPASAAQVQPCGARPLRAPHGNLRPTTASSSLHRRVSGWLVARPARASSECLCLLTARSHDPRER
eukprot:7484000-Prorocentrum_lima.AAC.1